MFPSGGGDSLNCLICGEATSTGGAVGGACGVRPLAVGGTGWPGEQSGIRTQRQTAQMTGKVVLSLMDEDPWNGFVRIMAWLISFDPEKQPILQHY